MARCSGSRGAISNCLASRVPLPSVADTSTLADCHLELQRFSERKTVAAVSERDPALAENERLRRTLDRERAVQARALREQGARADEELMQRDRDIVRGQDDIVALRETIAGLNDDIVGQREELDSLQAQVEAARQLNRRTEESVTWQAFQRLRSRFYDAIGETSLFARALRWSLRLAGRLLIKRPPPAPPPPAPPLEDDNVEVISIPEYENPKVSLIMSLHSGTTLARSCLNSIRDQTAHASYEVILVDDAAGVETKSLLDEIRGAKIVRNEKSLGYVRSVNRAASVARGRWFLLVNPNTEVTRGWLRALLDCAESAEDVGVVTPKFVCPDGRLSAAGGIVWRDGNRLSYGRGDAPDLFQYEYRRETDYGSATALMVRAKFWRDVDGFDERYVQTDHENVDLSDYMDVDLCYQARDRGLRVLFEPAAVVTDVDGGTTDGAVDLQQGRHQEESRQKFVAKWQHRLEAEQMRCALTNVRAAANRQRGPHVLVIDHCVPMWDRDAGSLRMLSVIRALLDIGARVTFMPDDLASSEPYSGILQRMGIEVLYGRLDVNAELATIGPQLKLALLSRPHPTGRWLDSVREFAPGATIVYDTVDLHWLREARASASEASPDNAVTRNNTSLDVELISPKAKALRQLELAMIRAADATILVSDFERAQVERDVPDAKLLVVPTIHEVVPHVLPPEDRSGILFVGGFRHPPNVGAAVRLVKDVMPTVWHELRDIRVTIVGAEPPPAVTALASPLVDVAGWIEDLQPLLEQSRVLVAPLDYGAGLKGKVTQCLAAGLPVVTTEIGAEGIDGLDRCVLIGGDPAELAAHVVRIYGDDALWRELSRAGQALIAEHCSPEMVSQRLGALLEEAPSQRSM
jgi:O-antigen biosynthesis protein